MLMKTRRHPELVQATAGNQRPSWIPGRLPRECSYRGKVEYWQAWLLQMCAAGRSSLQYLSRLGSTKIGVLGAIRR